MIERLFNRTKVLEKALDATWLRNDAIAQNIANVDTPNYKRKTVEFEEALNKAIDQNSVKGIRTHEKHIPIGERNLDSVQPKAAVDNKALSFRLDGNNVDIDNEMADMAKNTIKYNVLTQKLSGEFRKLRTVINEGRK